MIRVAIRPMATAFHIFMLPNKGILNSTVLSLTIETNESSLQASQANMVSAKLDI